MNHLFVWQNNYKKIIIILLIIIAFAFLQLSQVLKQNEMKHEATTGKEHVVEKKREDQKPSNDTLNHMIDLDNFHFVINPTETCDDCKEGTLIIGLIHTALNHADYRTAIRNSWGRSNDCLKFVFVTGVTDNVNMTEHIKRESEEYHDIIQGNFLDTYDNLTYKHVAGLKWVTHFCAKAKYIVKTDDDIFVNTNYLVTKLYRKEFGNKNLIACRVFERAPVFRNNSKWVIPKSVYSDDYYPNYCSGPFMIYSADVVPKLLQESYKLPYFRLEDVHITGTIAKRLGIKHLQLKKWYMPSATTLVSLGPKCIKPMIFGPVHIKEPSDIVRYWKVMNQEDLLSERNGSLCPRLGRARSRARFGP